MIQKRFIAVIVFVVLALAPAGSLHAQWMPTNGLYGGAIESLIVSGETLFASIDGSAYRSTNRGVSWSLANNGLPSDQGAYTIGSNGTDAFASYSGDLYIWSDKSLKWDKEGSLPGSPYVVSFGAKSNSLFAGAIEGVFRSTDTGSMWAELDLGIDEAYIYQVVGFASIDSFLFAAINNDGIFRSSDNGDHWIPADSALANTDIFSLLRVGNNLFAGTSAAGVLLSTDYGTRWESMSTGLPNSQVSALAAVGNTLVAGTGEGVYISTNNGANWHSATAGIPMITTTPLAVIGDTLFAGTGLGVFRSFDTGQTWTQASTGLTSMPPTSLSKMGNILYGGLWRSDDLGMNWKWAESDVAHSNDSIIDDPSVMVSIGAYLIAGSGGLFRSSDSGTTWDTVNVPLTTSGVQALAANKTEIFVGTGFGIFVSSDSGATWVDANNGLPPEPNVISLSASGNGVVAGLGASEVYLSTDGGKTWTPHNAGLNAFIRSVFAVDTFIYSEDIGDGLYRSSVNDSAWSSLFSPPNNTLSSQLLSFATIDTTLFAGTDHGIFASFDNGDNWIEIDSGLPNPYVYALAVDDSFLIASAYAAHTDKSPSIWRRPLSQITTSAYALGANADTINFGNLPVGKDSLRIVTLTNTGKTPLTIRSFQMTQSQSAFVTSDLSSEVELNPGETFTFVAFFEPTKPGEYTANMVVMSEAKRVNLTFIGSAYGDDGINEQLQPTSLLSVFPNPFSQSTQITFTPQSSGYAEVSLFNQLGVEIARLYSGELDAGAQHIFIWNNPSALPDGVYECFIRMNGQVEKLPIVLLQ